MCTIKFSIANVSGELFKIGRCIEAYSSRLLQQFANLIRQSIVIVSDIWTMFFNIWSFERCGISPWWYIRSHSLSCFGIDVWVKKILFELNLSWFNCMQFQAHSPYSSLHNLDLKAISPEFSLQVRKKDSCISHYQSICIHEMNNQDSVPS